MRGNEKRMTDEIRGNDESKQYENMRGNEKKEDEIGRQ